MSQTRLLVHDDTTRIEQSSALQQNTLAAPRRSPFAIAGVVAALTAFSYARLSVRYVSAGGTVTFVDRAFGIGKVTGSR